MLPLKLPASGPPLPVLCLGAHSDDIEIGAGGALLQWISEGARLNIIWCVLSASGDRADEARGSAESFLQGAAGSNIEVMSFRDGFFPTQGEQIKEMFETLKSRFSPDLILTHRRDDAHQDHREVCRHTWNTFRDHLILEYEIPKWDGDLGQPNLYVPLEAGVLARKIELLMKHFGTQRSKHWFDDETFRGLARLRGLECRAAERYAEAFFARKLIVA
ncbi:PIG-L deacetylase family protein [Hyphomicrobium facile]|uniref:N-acetylglucosaminyl deacetylase, LmbE family n=1 Tax=Hyphomicrobium facile TaxID=51670 RepID=A0A1I7NFF8_9HYPH|nr:PIG-L deacetylase family protein [Hyphomicrobium facile]SFV33407.1 N-acetylglucosaminyl deacetylase, LmbE family [Hyphomicrobium facile]